MIRNIAIVSLSSGIIGEPGVHFEIEIGLQRLKEYGLNVKFMPHALKGLEYGKAHPEKRARRLLPYLFDHDELKNAVTDKVFLGFSDTTINHLMFGET